MNRRLIDITMIAGLILACASSALWGQSRKQGSIHTAQISGVGEGRTATFRNYSFGVGNLQQTSSAGGTDLLRSSVGYSRSILRSGASGGAVGGIDALVPSRGQSKVAQHAQLYSPTNTLGGLSGSTAGEMHKALLKDAYAGGITGASRPTMEVSEILKEKSETITSMVPADPGRYRDFMEKGENYFHRDEYDRAFGQFKLAGLLVNCDPASLLSMAHAKFAVGSYSLASFYMQEAIKYLPELPLVSLNPKGFYKNPMTYVEHLKQFENYLDRNQTDADAYFLLAYYRWFGQDHVAAWKALEIARKIRGKSTSTRNNLTEAIDTFERAIQSSGKLPPMPEEASSKPAAEEEDASEAQDTQGK